MFPTNARQNKALADQLAAHLRRGIRNTTGRKEWSEQNFRLLREFSDQMGAKSFPSPALADLPRNRQFLWDHITLAAEGILIAAESEFMNDKDSIQEDFEKLLYVQSPIKLMLCRTRGQEETNRIVDWVQAYVKDYPLHAPGDVFLLYCVSYGDVAGENRDSAFILQIPGEPATRSADEAAFVKVSLDLP